MATRKEILRELPSEVFEKIKVNISATLARENRSFNKADHLSLEDVLNSEVSLGFRAFSLIGAFDFTESEEGGDYWWGIYREYFE